MRIYLIGYMGSGKSTLGRQLSQRLGISFLDMDHYIEQRYFRSVADIFREEGEMSFRVKEQACLREIAELENVVVATGGGAPCFFDNMEVMNRSGCCIFLDVPAEELASRLRSSQTVRPLISRKPEEELPVFIGEMLRERLPYYSQARYRVSSGNIAVNDLIQTLEHHEC